MPKWQRKDGKGAEDVARTGTRRAWMRQGTKSQAAIRSCEERDISAVRGERTLMFAEPA